MALDSLTIRGFRCLTEISLELDPHKNLITGPNASGKTSLLEAVYFLSRARSFRTPYLQQLIQDGAEECIVSGSIKTVSRETPIGVRCTRKQTEARLDTHAVKSLAELAHALPVQAIDPEIHKLLEEGPARRRKFLDWGVFHVEPTFLDHWRQYQRALKQRNAGLRRQMRRSSLNVWEKTLISHGEAVHAARQRHVDALLSHAEEFAKELLQQPMTMTLKSGWDNTLSLAEALERSWGSDQQYQSTQVGPHRADFQLRLAGKVARNRVSRGQQKLLASATVLAQMRLLESNDELPRILLLDDPAAELDRMHLDRLLGVVTSQDLQLLITSLEPELVGLDGPSRQVVLAQGKITKVV